MKCSATECDRPPKTRGLCQKHYVRLWRHGDPEAVRRIVIKGTLEYRLWARVTKGEHWLWTGNKNRKGYGYMSAGRKDEGKVLTHVLSWRLANGPIPDGMFVLHHCDIPLCVNPACLFLGTLADNNRDMCEKGRNHNQLKTHCPYGHEYTVQNTLRKKHGRQCRTCSNAYERKRRAARKKRW